MQTWRLDDARQTLLLAAAPGALPQILHWGAPLPTEEDTTALARAARPDITGGMLDATPPVSLCPDGADSFPGQPGLTLAEASGAPVTPCFVFEAEEVSQDALGLRYRDAALGVTLQFAITRDTATHMMTARTRLICDRPMRLGWLAAPVVLAAPQSVEMVDFTGRWCGEFQPVRTPWQPGARLRENRTGRSGHEHFPGLLVLGQGATNSTGEVWGFHYGWSGGHRMLAEQLPDGRRQVQFGNATGAETATATTFETAPLYLTYSDAGLNGCAVAFQRHLRDRVVAWPRPAAPRPVHYNCWEAVYFDHDIDTLKDIATRAAALGAERFVLDDGWFGLRDSDTSSLGDWQIDARKYPDGLAPLIDHIRALGMGFGLWFEPEMVNLDSDLARAHPDWILGRADQIEGRQQRVLDMARADVRDHLYARIAAVLAAHPVEYVKWDHNRVLPAPDAAQTRGTYALLDRLRADFRHVEIESCASGGGRIDFGILARTQRVWLSDSNDALERMRIQHEAALFLPSVVTGSHVGPRTCHTSGRVLDIETRAWVAAQRHMGFEMDPRELTDHEEQVLRTITAWWKANRDWLARADILRLDTGDRQVIGEQQLAEDGARFVAFAGRQGTSGPILPPPLRLSGLLPQARYRIHLHNRDAAVGLSRGSPLLKTSELVASGAWLMAHGLVLPWQVPGHVWVIEGERL